MPTITLSSGASFVSEAGISILDAALKAKISLPYSCKTGRCSTCKCKVTSGETSALQPESGITNEEKADGWILTCSRTVVSDTILDLNDLGRLELPLPKTLP